MDVRPRLGGHHGALRLFDAAAGCLADWSEFDLEAERWGVEFRGLSHEELVAPIEDATREIPTTKHRKLHQEEGDFVRWGEAWRPKNHPGGASSSKRPKFAH
jgi:hypothetical protein